MKITKGKRVFSQNLSETCQHAAQLAPTHFLAMEKKERKKTEHTHTAMNRKNEMQFATGTARFKSGCFINN